MNSYLNQFAFLCIALLIYGSLQNYVFRVEDTGSQFQEPDSGAKLGRSFVYHHRKLLTENQIFVESYFLDS